MECYGTIGETSPRNGLSIETSNTSDSELPILKLGRPLEACKSIETSCLKMLRIESKIIVNDLN